ncbi:unnamed protein product [Arabis nemorensis]|uniref:MATH domain-containing protein n=1 Tax=Arabis nemorensis TaxID=586526 RepID=A0A565BXN8_9BRAS|nr:unnamed protein product [Arabis nemorensis]
MTTSLTLKGSEFDYNLRGNLYLINGEAVVIGDYKWCLLAFPKGDRQVHSLSLYLELADYKSLPSGWRSYAKFRLSIVNQLSEELSVQREFKHCFNQKYFGWGNKEMLPLTKLHAKDGGFLVDDELLIVAEIDVFEVIGTKDVSKEALKKPLSEKESVDVNGFQVLPSQVESVRRIFELHPDIAAKFRGKNQHVRTACMNFLLSLMEMLRQPLKELSNEDLEEADIMLEYLKNAYFKVDWLEMELEQVKEKKETEKA